MVYKHNVKFKYQYRLITTRFTNETLYQLLRFKENHNMNDKSIYNIPIKLRYNNVTYEYPMIVLEMNNSTNKLIGMGFIINKSETNNPNYRIYSDNNYNRYTYKSRFYINFSKDSKDYLDFIKNNNHNKNIIKKLENICFCGKGHLKRGSSFMAVPNKHVTSNIHNSLMELFLKKYESNKKDYNLLIELTNYNEISDELIERINSDNTD